MPIEADYREEEENFGKNPENDHFLRGIESGEKSADMFGSRESFEKSPVNDMQSIFGNNAMGVVDGKHASMDEVNGAGNFGNEMPPPEAELPRPAMDFGTQGGANKDNPENPEPATSGPGAELPTEGFGDYNTLEK